MPKISLKIRVYNESRHKIMWVLIFCDEFQDTYILNIYRLSYNMPS